MFVCLPSPDISAMQFSVDSHVPPAEDTNVSVSAAVAVAVAAAAALVLFVSLVSHLVCLSRLGAFHAFVSRRAHEISIQLSMNERGGCEEGAAAGRGVQGERVLRGSTCDKR